MNGLRRYDILLPLEFNDGQPVPESLLLQTIEGLEAKYRAISWETQVVQGVWQHEGTVFRDRNTRLFVIFPDTLENRAFFVDLKEKLKARFRQLDILIVGQAVDVI